MADGYTTVTELPGAGATREQLSMLYTRYHMAGELAAGKDVLEVACGPGIGLGYLARKARRVVGGDFDPKLVEAARAHYGTQLEVDQMDAEHLPFGDRSFDVVLLLEAIYYLPHADKFVAEAHRVLRDGGTLFICSANREWTSFNASPFSVRYYSARELKDLLSAAGFSVELRAGYYDEPHGLKGKILGTIRNLAVKLHLIPKTMRAKQMFKRLFFGKLAALPTEITDGQAELHTPEPIEGSAPVTDHKVIYALGRVG